MTTIETKTNPLQEMQNTEGFTLREAVQKALSNYFSNLGDQKPAHLYDMVLAEIEAPLFEAMMAYTKGNQSKAAIFMGISRGTLRKKIKIYDLD